MKLSNILILAGAVAGATANDLSARDDLAQNAQEGHGGWLYCGHVLDQYDSGRYRPKMNEALEHAGLKKSNKNALNSLWVVGTTGRVGYFATCGKNDCVWNKGKPEDYCTNGYVKPKKA